MTKKINSINLRKSPYITSLRNQSSKIRGAGSNTDSEIYAKPGIPQIRQSGKNQKDIEI